LTNWRRGREKENVELVVYCLKIRVSRLEQTLEDYLLCKILSCEGCPGLKGNYSCGDYFEDVKKIVEKLRDQVGKWIQESQELEKRRTFK